ncbi:MAG: hypothetical protein HDS32_06355 [Bacteroides sp.]|nr:hypothetical protein [Bacteroides sp.]
MNTTYYSGQAAIYTPRATRSVNVGRRDCLMCYGDRISVRVEMGNKTVMSYETKVVADMTDLTGDLRRRGKNLRGLAVAYIRNHDKGWTKEQRIMFYPDKKYAPTKRVTAVQVPMFFPWEL